MAIIKDGPSRHLGLTTKVCSLCGNIFFNKHQNTTDPVCGPCKQYLEELLISSVKFEINPDRSLWSRIREKLGANKNT